MECFKNPPDLARMIGVRVQSEWEEDFSIRVSSLAGISSRGQALNLLGQVNNHSNMSHSDRKTNLFLLNKL